jgi:phosphoglycerate kinase
MNELREQVQKRSIERYPELKGKRVLLRIDVNTSLGDNGVVDPGEDWRIIKSYQTIDYLVEQGACVVVVSHIGRNPEESLKPVYEYMRQHLNIGFLPSYDDELLKNSLENMQHGSVIMLENLRQHTGEKSNDSSFLQTVIDMMDMYVNST